MITPKTAKVSQRNLRGNGALRENRGGDRRERDGARGQCEATRAHLRPPIFFSASRTIAAAIGSKTAFARCA